VRSLVYRAAEHDQVQHPRHRFIQTFIHMEQHHPATLHHRLSVILSWIRPDDWDGSQSAISQSASLTRQTGSAYCTSNCVHNGRMEGKPISLVCLPLTFHAFVELERSMFVPKRASTMNRPRPDTYIHRLANRSMDMYNFQLSQVAIDLVGLEILIDNPMWYK